MPLSTEELKSRVLSDLRDDGRASYARIAAQHGSTRRQITHIVQHEIAQGRLRLTASISADLLGHQRFAYVQISTSGPIAPIREALNDMPETTFVAEISGNYAIDAEIRVGADPHLRATIDHIRSLPGVHELRLHLYESIEINLFSPIRTGDAHLRIDHTDRTLIQHLQRDGRATFKELGDAAGISPSGARVKLKRLMQHGAVKVVGIPVRDKTAETPTLGVGIHITGPLTAALNRVREIEPEFLAITVGEYDLIATLSGETTDAVLDLVDRLRASPEIARIETWANLRIAKEQYGEGDRIIVNAYPSPVTVPRTEQSATAGPHDREDPTARTHQRGDL